MTKVERFAGPGGPNSQILEYYFKSPTHVFVFTVNYGTYNPEVDQDGTVEKEILPKILSTLEVFD